MVSTPDRKVQPEIVEQGTPQWERWNLHRAANLWHAAKRLPPGAVRLYKVAWVASCILYDRQKLLHVGGFSFWSRLPRFHSGEEVLVQNLLMRRWGGCGMAPSGTYYSQLNSTVLNEAGSVDGHALHLLPEMVQRYAVGGHVSDPFEPGILERLPASPLKVVILRTNRIGDFILATPALRALRTALPAAQFAFIGLPFLRDLAVRSTLLDRFIEFPGFPGMAEQFFDARQALGFFARMQDEYFDLAIQLNGSGVYSNPFALMLGAKYTVGWVRPGEGAGRLNAALPMPESGHEIDRVLTLPLFLRTGARGRETEFPLRSADCAAAAELVAGAARPLIGVHPGGREMTKRWAPERFARAARDLQRDLGGTVIVVGGPDESELASSALRVLRADACPASDITGRTSLPQLGSLIEQMTVLLTNDSGPAHIAYALGTPTVTIFGGTDPARWGPPASPRFAALTNPVACWPCSHWVCPLHLECLDGITVESVVEAARRVITEGREDAVAEDGRALA